MLDLPILVQTTQAATIGAQEVYHNHQKLQEVEVK